MERHCRDNLKHWENNLSQYYFATTYIHRLVRDWTHAMVVTCWQLSTPPTAQPHLGKESTLGHYTVRPAITILSSKFCQNNYDQSTRLQCAIHWICKSQFHCQMWGSHSNVAEVPWDVMQCHWVKCWTFTRHYDASKCWTILIRQHSTTSPRTLIFCIENVTQWIINSVWTETVHFLKHLWPPPHATCHTENYIFIAVLMFINKNKKWIFKIKSIYLNTIFWYIQS